MESQLNRKKAFISGISGQDGSYLAEFLLSKGYEVHGLIRQVSALAGASLRSLIASEHALPVTMHYGDILDSGNLTKLIAQIEPDEIYHLAAQSHVRISFDAPVYTGDVTALGTTRMLEAIRTAKLPCKFYQAGSSEMFGKVLETPQSEKTPFNPRSPYGSAKAYAHYLTKQYREAYGIFACNGILFNHESPRRGDMFVTRKISKAVANIKLGRQKSVRMGNLDAIRDWGYAKEYVEAMWLMLQQPEPDDYVIATGELYSVRDFLQEAFSYVDLDWQNYVDIDDKFYRPLEVDLLVGDASKAREKLGWLPKTSFKELVHLMVDADMAVLRGQVFAQPAQIDCSVPQSVFDMSAHQNEERNAGIVPPRILNPVDIKL